MNVPGLWHTHPVAIEETTFEPYCPPGHENDYNGERLEDLCNLAVDHVDDLTCTTSAGISGVAGTGFLLKLEGFGTRLWDPNSFWMGWSFYFDPDSTNPIEKWYEPGHYVMDPPDGSEDQVAILEAASHQLSGLVVRKGSVLLTRIEGGAEKCTDEMPGMLPASE